MGCVVLYVINGPCGLHTYQENKKVRMGSEYGKLCGGSGRLVDLLELRWGMVHVFVYGMLFGVGIKNHWRPFFNEVNYLSKVFFAHTRHW